MSGPRSAAPLRVRRVELHPWAWVGIVSRSVVLHTSGDLTRARREACAAILDRVAETVPADDECDLVYPYLPMSSHEVRARTKRNAELEARDPVDFRYAKDSIENGQVVPGYRPIPNPDLRRSVDLTFAEHRVLEEAVEAYSKRADVDHGVSRCLLETMRAIEKAVEVEVAPVE